MKRVKRGIVGLAVVFVCVCTIGVFEVDASTSEADYYTKVLKNQLFIEDANGNMDLGTEFLLYDINKDGHKELIVNGMVGGKGEEVSIIYSPKKNKYIKSVLLGRVEKVSSKGVYTLESSQSGAGLYYSEIRYVYQLDSLGKASMVLCKYTNSEYDMSAQKYKTTDGGYSKYSGKKETKITKKKYQSLTQKYKFKKATTHLITTENIKKYVK